MEDRPVKSEAEHLIEESRRRREIELAHDMRSRLMILAGIVAVVCFIAWFWKG